MVINRCNNLYLKYVAVVLLNETSNVLSFCVNFVQEDIASLIPELCSQFYHLGWMTGTGGAMSIRERLEAFLIFLLISYITSNIYYIC